VIILRAGSYLSFRDTSYLQRQTVHGPFRRAHSRMAGLLRSRAPQRLLCRVAKGEAEVPNDSLQARFSPKPPRLEKNFLVSVALFRGRPVFRKVRDQFRVPLEPHIPKPFLTEHAEETAHDFSAGKLANSLSKGA
jgi:hypothetical protein